MDYQGVRSASINRHLHDSICVIVWARPEKNANAQYDISSWILVGANSTIAYSKFLSMFLKFQVHGGNVYEANILYFTSFA
jgi:hypothetical protein